MEKDELTKMLQLYKARLADTEEQCMIFQVMISKLINEKDTLTNEIQLLNNQLEELRVQASLNNPCVMEGGE